MYCYGESFYCLGFDFQMSFFIIGTNFFSSFSQGCSNTSTAHFADSNKNPDWLSCLYIVKVRVSMRLKTVVQLIGISLTQRLRNFFSLAFAYVDYLKMKSDRRCNTTARIGDHETCCTWCTEIEFERKDPNYPGHADNDPFLRRLLRLSKLRKRKKTENYTDKIYRSDVIINDFQLGRGLCTPRLAWIIIECWTSLKTIFFSLGT